jgi:hypothetical protein
MTDQRELIMVRLAEVVNVTGVKTVSRNRIDFDDTQLPAVGVLEGDEEVGENTLGRSARASGRPYIVTATPQVFIRVGGISENIGTDLNTLRAAIIKALLDDADLTAMSMDDGGMQYAGMQSMLHAARSMIGATAMVFVIKYLLYPDRL